jgi:hypothetical protein
LLSDCNPVCGVIWDKFEFIKSREFNASGVFVFASIGFWFGNGAVVAFKVFVFVSIGFWFGNGAVVAFKVFVFVSIGFWFGNGAVVAFKVFVFVSIGFWFGSGAIVAFKVFGVSRCKGVKWSRGIVPWKLLGTPESSVIIVAIGSSLGACIVIVVVELEDDELEDDELEDDELENDAFLPVHDIMQIIGDTNFWKNDFFSSTLILGGMYCGGYQLNVQIYTIS